jgi:lycopene cyclase domain-containing protein
VIEHYSYLAIILIPGLPSIICTWYFGRKVLMPQLKLALLAILALTLYCVAIDILAIRVLGIWWFRPEMVTGVQLLGDYLEEWILFLVTQTLAVSWFLLLREAADPLETVKNWFLPPGRRHTECIDTPLQMPQE